MKTEKVYPPNIPGYKYVNPEDPRMSFKEMADRAAQTMFWTELARGFAVTLAHIFKVHCFYNYFLIYLFNIEYEGLHNLSKHSQA